MGRGAGTHRVTRPLFTEAELRDLVSRDEGQFLEFKSTWDRSGDIPKQVKRRSVRDAIAETVAAFANADGGPLLVGVEDDGSPTGHSYPENVIEDFVSVPRKRLKPSVSCRADRLGIAGVEVLAFNVPIAPEAVMVTGNGFPYRVGDHVTREPQEIINERKQAYRRVGYEQRFRARCDPGRPRFGAGTGVSGTDPGRPAAGPGGASVLWPDRSRYPRLASDERRVAAVRQGTRASMAAARGTAAVSRRGDKPRGMAGNET